MESLMRFQKINNKLLSYAIVFLVAFMCGRLLPLMNWEMDANRLHLFPLPISYFILIMIILLQTGSSFLIKMLLIGKRMKQ